MGISQFQIAYGGGAPKPTVTAGTTTSSSVPLSWTSVAGASSYDIYATGASRLFITSTSGTSYTVSGLSSSTSYTFEVYAKNAAGVVIASTSTSSAPTTPVARAWIGRNLAMQSSTYTVGSLTSTFAGSSQASMTMAQGFKNKESWPIVSVRLLFAGTETTSAAVRSARVANKGAGTITSPSGSWSQVTFNSGSNSWTPPSGSYSTFNINAIVSDEITLSTPCPAGGTVVIWSGLSGGASLNMTLPGENGNNFMPSLFAVGNFCGGDYASAGSSGSPSWTGSDLGGPVALLLCTYDTGSGAPPLVNIVVGGDSVWAGVPPFDGASHQTYGDHWCEVVNNTARTNGKHFRMVSIGQGGDTMQNTNTRLTSLNGVGFLAFCDKFIAQAWSWNNRNNADGSLMQAALVSDKSMVTGAGRAWGVGILSPMGQDDTAHTVPTDFTTLQQSVYTGQDTYMSTTAPSANWNVSSSVWDSADHLRHLAANSYDNVHCYIGGGVGQDLQGAAVYSAELTVLAAQGYTV